MADEKQTRSPESVFVDSVHLSLASWVVFLRDMSSGVGCTLGTMKNCG